MADGIHITRKMWRALEEGRLPRRLFDRLVREHLFGTCETCRAEHQAHLRESGYDGVFSRLAEGRPAQERRVRKEKDRAARDLEELLELPEERRLGRIERARRRFRGRALAELLLEKSWAALPGSPGESFHFAALAEAAVFETAGEGAGDSLVRALTFKANALRAMGRLAEAAPVFRVARELIRKGLAGPERQMIVDLDVYGLLDWWEGVCYYERAEFQQGEELLSRAALLFSLEGADDKLHRVVLSLGELYAKAGRLEEAMAAVGKVLESLREEEDPGLYWIARFNYAVYLADSGLYAEALQEVSTCRRSEQARDRPFFLQRLEWLSGRIAFGLGDHTAAERCLVRVREGFLEQGSSINMALVSLDLGLVYLRQGRARELKRLAEEIGLIFDSQEVHREMAAALILFQDAARQERLSADYLERLRRYLEEARHRPDLQFEWPH